MHGELLWLVNGQKRGPQNKMFATDIHILDCLLVTRYLQNISVISKNFYTQPHTKKIVVQLKYYPPSSLV
jgi:hypothetical protein